ncbi:hypothetical protein Runsl_5604 [Runella slithyformis DSM 19594]|uniref:Uncharacterized protein n=1 Tax=Runella slithyformis (strain ATCC 29530 / DSM 19594 / LMG 11500 / NCIMB 11436 / LSU 4) TaxID=761193 RepID=A0A7U4E8W3_RUNSL|nr:hypothetical protein Runsl_5604 [Runella slithyformis DSM 19594]
MIGPATGSALNQHTSKTNLYSQITFPARFFGIFGLCRTNGDSNSIKNTKPHNATGLTANCLPAIRETFNIFYVEQFGRVRIKTDI